MKIQITNIARDLTEDELKNLFAKFGPVLECTLVMDKVTGKSKGFGFVTMGNLEVTDRAVHSINGKMVNGVKIKAKITAAD